MNPHTEAPYAKATFPDDSRDLEDWEDWEHADHLEDITCLLDSTGWEAVTITGRNIGWRNLTGTLDAFYNGDAQEFCEEFLPNCDRIEYWEFYEDRIEIRVSHHDSPTGEFYTITKEAKWQK